MGKHALLSASSSHRWLACPPSARLCEKYEDKSSEYAKQGTDAHSLCEYRLKTALGRKANNPIESLSFYDSEMEDCAEGYVEYVVEQIAALKDPLILIEQRLDFSRYVEEGFGTGDCVLVADKDLVVIDFKYGQGVLVEAEKNSQLMCYALGAVSLFDGLYDIDTIHMTIYQPRRENIGTYVLSKNDLLTWANEVLTPTAKLAYAGKGEFQAGEHCRFCKAKAECRKRAEYYLELAKYDFASPTILEKWEINEILGKVDSLTAWVADIKEYALQKALHGEKWVGYKLVEGDTKRRYTDKEAVAKVVKAAGMNPYENKLLGITKMSKLLGKERFQELLNDYIIKPKGALTLVPNTDKRKAVQINCAAEDFKED